MTCMRSCDPAHASDVFVTPRPVKTKATGEKPPVFSDVFPSAPGESPVWVGDQALPAEQQGFLVLGTPTGRGLQTGRPPGHDAQQCRGCVTFNLRGCARGAPCSNFLLRSLAPFLTDEFAGKHDDVVMT